MSPRRPSSVARLLAVLGGMLLLISCSDGEELLDDSPGAYDGSSDPLTERSAEDRASVLSERLKLVQGRE